MTNVNLLPDSPLLPLLVTVALAATATQRNASWPAGALGLIVFASIIYQFTGFMIWTARNTIGVILVVAVAAGLLINFITASREATSMALAVLAVATMFTPFYYLSVALIVAAAATGEEKRMWPMSITYVATLTPLLILENGLNTTNTTNNGPLIFIQLTNLAENMRPPLTSLNVFLSGATADGFQDATAQPVLNYMTGPQVFQLIIPLTILALIFSLTTTTAGITNKTLRRLAKMDDSKLLQNLTPLIVSIITPITFTTLLNGLSLRSLGGYQTTLQATDTLYMTLGSLALGSVYAAKEYATARLEKKQKARDELKIKLDTLKRTIKENEALIDQIRLKSHSIDLTSESNVAKESATMIPDIENGLDHADYNTITRWTAQVDETTHRLNHTPENIRLRTITEHNTLTNYAKTYSETLKEAGIIGAFKWTNEANGDTTLQQAITQYTRLTHNLREDTQTLYTKYKKTHKAYDILTSRPTQPPTVDPNTLLEADRVEDALKLVAEEYWLRYHNGAKHELGRSVPQLLVAAQKLKQQHPTNILEDAIKTLKNPEPKNTPKILETIQTLKTTINEFLIDIEQDDERLQEKLRYLSPHAEELLATQKLLQKKSLEQLRDKNKFLPPTIIDTVTLLDEATTTLKTHVEERRRSDENLLIAAHYPSAKTIITEKISDASKVPLNELPYTSHAARIYANLYTHEDSTTEYDEENDEVRRHVANQ